jgi:hypothetical protein
MILGEAAAQRCRVHGAKHGGRLHGLKERRRL